MDEAFIPGRAMHAAAGSGSSTGIGRSRLSTSLPDISTQNSFRLLTLRGLAPAEAANLTAFLCGIPVADRRWALREINQLLFLRDLRRQGRFGPTDGDV